MNRLLSLSATALAGLIRNREVTSQAVVEAHIGQIQRVNGTLNAVVKERFDAARDEARSADARTKNVSPGELPVFHGVPCTIKEAARLAGMPHSSGLVARASVVAAKDGTAAARLRAAGAIPLGVTNISELCMWMESNNRVYGLTRNPYDAARTAGGSSGGEGSIVGAGGSPFGLGSDIGGSIRMPAFFNGVFGHKPTGGLVPSTGSYPDAAARALRYLTTGPIARRAEDLMPFLRVVAGPDGEDVGCRTLSLGDPSAVSLEGLTVVHVVDNGRIAVAEDLKAAQRRCLYHLASRGAHIKEARVEGLKQSLEIWSSMLAEAGGRTFSDFLGNGTPIRTVPSLARWAARRSPYTLPAIALALVEPFAKIMPAHTRKMIALGEQLRDELVELIGDNGVMLYPPYTTVAPKHQWPMASPFNWVYTAVLNVMELPVTQVPLGLNDDGLPLGVQVVGAHGNDHVTIAVAMELERAFGGWVPPKMWS